MLTWEQDSTEINMTERSKELLAREHSIQNWFYESHGHDQRKLNEFSVAEGSYTE